MDSARMSDKHRRQPLIFVCKLELQYNGANPDTNAHFTHNRGRYYETTGARRRSSFSAVTQSTLRRTHTLPIRGGAAPYPLTAWRRRSDGKAVRTSTVCSRMRRRAHSTRSSPPLAMKAGIHSTLPLRLLSRCKNRSLHSSLTRSWKARCTTEGFMVTRLVRQPTSPEYSSTGAKLHLETSKTQQSRKSIRKQSTIIALMRLCSSEKMLFVKYLL